MIRKIVMVVLMLVAAAGSMELWADTDTSTRRIDRRQHRQMHGIRQGVRSGQLTGSEAKELRQDERQIQQKKCRAKSDGVVTAEERKEINTQLNQQRREIYEEKHDAETR